MEHRETNKTVHVIREHYRVVNELLIDDELIGEVVEYQNGDEEVTCHVDWMKPTQLKRIVEEWRGDDYFPRTKNITNRTR